MKSEFRRYNSRNRKFRAGWPSALVQSLKRSFRVYCENTGLHGFRYIVSSKSMWDRIAWFTICISSIIFCVILMLRQWDYFLNNPTATAIDTSNSITELHFPAITVCNYNKVYKPHAIKIAQELTKKGLDINVSKKLFSSLRKLIRPDKPTIDNATASWVLDTLGYSVEKLMFELMQPCSLLVVRCFWLSQQYDCNKIFKTVKSNEGFCCSFNYHFELSNNFRDENAWLTNITTVEEDSDGHNSTDFLPGVGDILFVPGTGRDVGLTVAFNIDAKNYRSPVRQFVGASVLIHDPLDYPDVSAQSVTLQPGHSVTITLSGTKTHSTKDIKDVAVDKRRCLFDDEMPGERQYSFQTCISTCMQRLIYGFCGCLPFFYPREHPNERTCYLTDIDCILSRRRNLSYTQLSYISECNCYSQCTDTSYEVVSESIPLQDFMYDSELTHDLDVKKTAFLFVYFRDGTYLEYRKRFILGWDSLLASFGGIFGLCLGGSVIGFIELIYYILTNFIARERKQEQRNQNIPPASKLFISVPANVNRKKYNATTLNKNAILTWDKQFSQRCSHQFSRKNTIDIKPSTFYQ